MSDAPDGVTHGASAARGASATPRITDEVVIADTMRGLLAARAPDASICPSEVARALWPDEATWRARMPDVRRVASRLAASGLLHITQGDSVLPDADSASGPIRLRRGPAFDAAHD